MHDSIRLMHVVNSGSVLQPFLAEQLRYMAAQGLDVAVCAPGGGTAEAFVCREKVRFFPVPVCRSIAPAQDARSIFRLVRHFHLYRPDIVHAHGPKAGLVAMIAAAWAKTPVRIYHVRGLPFLSDTQPRRILRTSTQMTCALANQVLSISPSMTRALIGAGCCPASKVKTLGQGSGNGVDASHRFNPQRLAANERQRVRSELAIPSNAFVLGFVGRMVKDKGIVELIAAWNELRAAHPCSHLMIVGPLERRDPIPDDTLKCIAADPRIHWLGEDRDTPRLYAAMDLLALPSYREGLGLVLLEAGAMGLPVIATRIPGCIDAVQDGVTGLLIPTRDAKSLALAVSKYLRSPKLCEFHGRNGRARVLSHFQQRAVWDATYDEYRRLLGRCGISLPVPNDAVTLRAA